MKINMNDIKKIVVEINGSRYEVSARTLAKEKELADINENASHNTVYEHEKLMITAMIGTDAYDKIFPVEEEINMDFMDAVYYGLVDAYTQNEQERKKRDEAEKAKELARQLKPLTDATRELAPAMEAVNREQRRAGQKVK